jgi:hypothetical protein
MSTRELILLSPYRFPAQSAQYLGDDDVTCLLNGCAALWHPAALFGATGPPRLASPYDHEEPTAGHLYAIPETPPLVLPDDWEHRVRSAGAAFFRATPDRRETLDNLRDALRDLAPEAPLLDLETERAAPFFGIGFGYHLLDALFEAMEHERMLSGADFWEDVSGAVAALNGPDPDAPRRHLQAAADRLQGAREVLYPVTLHVIDLWLFDGTDLDAAWPAAFEKGLPLNVVAAAALLERLGRERPDRLAALRERVAGSLVEVCGGPYVEREDVLLPVESQLWNLLKGQQVYRALLGQEVTVFGRKRFAAHPQLPLFLQNAGISRALFVAFDEAVLPSYRSLVVNLPSPDGKQVESFTHAPLAADSPQTFFHLAHHLHRTIMQDHAATIALVHKSKPAGPWYNDWLELTRLAPVLGRWTTLTGYLNEVLSGEYVSAPGADEFHGDYLAEREEGVRGQGLGVRDQESGVRGQESRDRGPVSGMARHVRDRRYLDAAWTFTALQRGLTGRRTADEEAFERELSELEDRSESRKDVDPEALAGAMSRAAEGLAGRLIAGGKENNPGILVLNPCSFTRRVVVEMAGGSGPLPGGGPVKAAQLDGTTVRLVVEVPGLGFAWVPRTAEPGSTRPTARMRLADERGVRNEFFEAEIDPATGGLRVLRDQRTRVGRLGQQLVYNPGSTLRVKSVQVTSTGPALGEIVTEGELLDAHNTVLAHFRQRFRAWLGRPVLDLRIEIEPVYPPQGYPWHAYYGARFAWRDERMALLRGVNGTACLTSHTRPETPDFLELRQGRQNTVILPGGLPFHQRHGGRMLDVVLVTEGETARTFDLAVGLDREHPMQTAVGMVTPVAVVPTTKGPPHVGATGWLFHLDAPNLLLTNLRPGADGTDAVTARLLECASHTGPAELRCVRDPVRATLTDARGMPIMDAETRGDAVLLEVTGGDLVQVRVEFR